MQDLILAGGERRRRLHLNQVALLHIAPVSDEGFEVVDAERNDRGRLGHDALSHGDT